MLMDVPQFSRSSRVQLFATPWTAARQASLSITNSRSLLKLMSSKSVMPSYHLILCHPLHFLPSVFPSIRVFSNDVLSHSVVSNSLWPHGLSPTRLLCPWGFSRQGCWSGLPFPSPGDLPNPGIEPRSPSLQVDSLLPGLPGKPNADE